MSTIPDPHPGAWAWSLLTPQERQREGGDMVRWWERIGRERRYEIRQQWHAAGAPKARPVEP